MRPSTRPTLNLLLLLRMLSARPCEPSLKASMHAGLSDLGAVVVPDDPPARWYIAVHNDIEGRSGLTFSLSVQVSNDTSCADPAGPDSRCPVTVCSYRAVAAPPLTPHCALTPAHPSRPRSDGFYLGNE